MTYQQFLIQESLGLAADKTFNMKRSIKVEKDVQSPQRPKKVTGLTSHVIVRNLLDK